MTNAAPANTPSDEIAATAAAVPADAGLATPNALPSPFNHLEPDDGFERIALRPDVGHAEYVVSYDPATQELALRNLTHGLFERVAIGPAGPIAPGETRDVAFDRIGAVITLNAAFAFSATLEDFTDGPLFSEAIHTFDVVSVEGDISGADEEIVFTVGETFADVTAVSGVFSADGIDFSRSGLWIVDELNRPGFAGG